MAHCAMTIELDETENPRMGGEAVSGTVIVTTTEQVKCSGLEVTTYWSTHGRGNIARGDVDRAIVFQGTWDSNREYRYKFSLKTAAWPPTYYGTYLNVSQWVQARAQVPWAKDPKTEVEVPVIAAASPEDLKPTPAANPKSTSMIGWIVGGIVILILIPFLGLLAAFLLPFIVIGGGCYWFFRVFLPKQMTGSIECSIEPKRVAPGETLKGMLRFTPKRNMTVNRIQWTVTCFESCVSGSGSKRTTHRHEILKQSEQLAGAGELRFGQPQSFEFSFPVPAEAPPSMKFNDNELSWSGELRIDIARWPDWVQTTPLTITANGKPIGRFLGGTVGGQPSLPMSEEEKWFDEVLRQVAKSSHDPNLVRTVLDAVRDHVFTIRVDIDGPLDDVPASYAHESGHWMLAIHRQSDMELALLWPTAEDAPADDTPQWSGQAVMLDYDGELDCLLMRIVPAKTG